MSETDSLLPVKRKTQQVIAARSSIGDTLVEETDGPQISKYGHSHASFASSYPSTQYLVATPSFVRFTMAITSIIFAYDGQKIYPEFISGASAA